MSVLINSRLHCFLFGRAAWQPWLQGLPAGQILFLPSPLGIVGPNLDLAGWPASPRALVRPGFALLGSPCPSLGMMGNQDFYAEINLGRLSHAT